MNLLPYRVRKVISDHLPLLYHVAANIGREPNSVEHWNDRLRDTWDARDWPIKVERIVERTTSTCAVLDVGCGTGSILRRLAERGYGELHGLELSDYAIARLRSGGITMWKGMLPDLPMASATFDVVIASQVLEHIIRRTRFAREIARVLKPGGQAFIFVPDHCLGPIEEREHVIRYDRRTLHRFLGRTFEVVSVESMKDTNYEMSVLFAHVRKKSS